MSAPSDLDHAEPRASRTDALGPRPEPGHIRDDQRAGDPLGDAASDVFDDLASGDLDGLEHRSSPYRHGRLTRLMIRAAGRDPHCTPRGEVGMCAAVALSLLFTGAWQVTAVIVAAQYEVGLAENPIVLALVALVVAIAVVMFDWTIIQGHLRGGVGRKTWVVRMVFTLCMIFLVSEVVASAMFDQDIQNQLKAENKTKADALAVELRENQQQMDGGLDKIAVLDGRINDAERRVNDAEARMVKEENGYGARAGRRTRYNLAKLDRDKAKQDLDAARRDRSSQGAEQEERLASLKQQEKDARTAADDSRIVKLGPGNREELLWTYLLANPSALFFKRIPLAVILICLDAFALLIGLTISRRTRELHENWESEQREWETAARFVRARVLQDAKRMIGHLVMDGMMGAAEQRARRARRKRSYRATEDATQDRVAHDAWMSATAPGLRPDRGSAKIDEARSAHDEEDAAEPVQRVVRVVGDGEARKPAATVPQTGATAPRDTDDGGGAAFVETPFEEPATAQRLEVRLTEDPAEQSDKDLAPFLDEWYETDDLPVRAVRRLNTVGSRESRRATLLLGINDRNEYHVIKLFSVSGADNFANNDLSRDASNARRMTQFSGGLAAGDRRDGCLAPGYFGTRPISGYPDVPYLVMPYYPSGSVKEYLSRWREQLTLDWCLRVSEQMFRICARLGEKDIVSCDAKLSNFVLAHGAYSPVLTPADERAIGPALHMETGVEPPEPEVRMIDLSMVYERGQTEERPTRGSRGTEYWSSPRAMSGIKDELPYELTNLDDAFSIAINTIYLLTEQEPPYPKGMRVALEVLGGGNFREEAPLIELSEVLMHLSDRREMGHRAEDMLVAGRDWLRSKNLGEDQACAAAANHIRGIRNVLGKEFVLHQPFRGLDFLPAEQDFARAS